MARKTARFGPGKGADMPRTAKPWYRKDRQAWYAWIGGKLTRLGEGHPEAVANFRRLQAAEGAPIPRGVDPPTREILALFLDQVERSLRPATFGWYRGHLASFEREHGGVLASRLRPLHVTSW